MIHGSDVSIGCLAMGDHAIEDLFVLAADTGIENVSVILCPFDPRIRSNKPSRPVQDWVQQRYVRILSELGRLKETVRVAAVQCYSRMGEIEYNRQMLTRLITEATEKGARIIVTPECAVCGYMDPATDMKWSARPVPGDPEMDVGKVAEPVPGPSTRHFSKLAARLRTYLAISLIEESDGKLYNSQVLLDPRGAVAAHHRKVSPWTPGDGLWMTPGEKTAHVADTPYGRLGLMICHDYHVLPEVLARKKTDIVLYSVGWVAPNPKGWFGTLLPRKVVDPNKFSLIVANWSADKTSEGWPGHGYSCIIDMSGQVLSTAKKDRGSEIVYADLLVSRERE
jgi:predicted amidohydrolase